MGNTLYLKYEITKKYIARDTVYTVYTGVFTKHYFCIPATFSIFYCFCFFVLGHDISGVINLWPHYPSTVRKYAFSIDSRVKGKCPPIDRVYKENAIP